jgi:hypothetical protein
MISRHLSSLPPLRSILEEQFKRITCMSGSISTKTSTNAASLQLRSSNDSDSLSPIAPRSPSQPSARQFVLHGCLVRCFPRKFYNASKTPSVTEPELKFCRYIHAATDDVRAAAVALMLPAGCPPLHRSYGWKRKLRLLEGKAGAFVQPPGPSSRFLR